jgi:hypothetical protein
MVLFLPEGFISRLAGFGMGLSHRRREIIYLSAEEAPVTAAPCQDYRQDGRFP